MARPIPCAHGLPSITSCRECRRLAVLAANKRWRNRLSEERYQQMLARHRELWAIREAAKPKLCKTCGKKRRPHRQFCWRCLRDNISYKDARYYNRNRDRILARKRALREAA